MTAVSIPKPKSRRGSELVLILFALAIGMFAYANIGFAKLETLPSSFYTFSIFMALIALSLHLWVRKFAPYADPLLIPLVLVLNCVGLAMIFRIDLSSDTTLANKQIMWTAVGVIAACAVLFFIRDHRVLRRYPYLSMIAAILLALSPLIPGLGKEIHGAQIWIHIGPASLQPAELSKILLAIFFAGYLVENRDRLAIAGPKILGLHLPRMRDFGPILLVWGVSLGILIFQRDLGTSLLYFGLFVAMLYVATERTSWILIGGALFAAGAVVVVAKFPHVQNRFDGWLHALDNDVYNAPGGSWQLVNGLFGMANGGIFGTGWGQGTPTNTTFAYSDFIIASLGEELGLVGLFAILVVYLLFVERGFRIALSTRDGFGKLLAGGLAFVIAWQCFVVIGGVTRLIPLTGLTTPFLAYGGSSLLANWVIVALLLRISDNARRSVPLPLQSGVTDESSDDAVLVELDDSGAPLERRVPGGSVQNLGQVGGPSTQDTGVFTRRSTKSFVSGDNASESFAPSDSLKTEVHRVEDLLPESDSQAEDDRLRRQAPASIPPAPPAPPAGSGSPVQRINPVPPVRPSTSQRNPPPAPPMPPSLPPRSEEGSNE